MKRLALIPQPPPEGVEVNANCARCMAVCCNYVSQEIDAPTTPKDYDVQRIVREMVEIVARAQDVG